MFDRRPFEHRLFHIIARDFPFLQMLLVSNMQQQQDKDGSCALIPFSNLTYLCVADARIDYAMQFLCNQKMNLPRLVDLSITYQTLATVTNYFTNNQTRLICARLTHLHICESFVRPSNFHLYFPLL